MENSTCKWCGNPKKWIYIGIALIVIMMVFCAGFAAGKFESLRRGQYGFERGTYQQGGFYGRPMMRGNRFYGDYTNSSAPTNEATTTTSTTAPAQQ